jgi:hypothetical protein
MTDDRFLELGTLTLDAARTMVGQEFVRSHDSGPDIVLRLFAAEAVRLDPSAQPNPSGRPFSLLFKGPTDPQLTQGIHDLGHVEHPLPGIFLVPVGRSDDGFTYEAVFS